MVIEFVIILTAFYIAGYNLSAAGVFAILAGGSVYSVMTFKKYLPQHFFRNFFKYLTQPRVYLTASEINIKNPAFRGLLAEIEQEERDEDKG